MKTCPTRLQLEAAVLGEVHEGRVAELDAHADGCPRCRHELNWLRTESALFAQRTAREEVSKLWEAVDARASAKRTGSITRTMLAIAASVMVAVIGARFVTSLGLCGARHTNEPVPMSLEMMSVDQASGDGDALATMPCYTPGFGIACGEVQYASR
jgi:anti-sigma factor RsiW